MGAAMVDSLDNSNKIQRKPKRLLGENTKFAKGNERLSYQVWISIGFAKRDHEIVLFLECLQQGFVWSSNSSMEII